MSTVASATQRVLDAIAQGYTVSRLIVHQADWADWLSSDEVRRIGQPMIGAIPVSISTLAPLHECLVVLDEPVDVEHGLEQLFNALGDC